MTSELPEMATDVETDVSRAKRRKNSARRAGLARRAAQDARGARLSLKTGPLSPSAANRPPLTWDPDMEEAGEEPPYILLPDKYFTIYEHGRRHLRSGRLPPELAGQHGIRIRTWRAYQRRMAQEPPWGNGPNATN